MVQKNCRVCGESKPTSEFYKKSGRLNVGTICKTCQKKHNAAYFLVNADKKRAQARAHYRNDTQGHWARRLMTQYKIEPFDWFRMLERQGYRCAICRASLAGLPGKQVHTDHDKGSGKVRGVLCHACNTGIGNLRHSASILASATAYLGVG